MLSCVFVSMPFAVMPARSSTSRLFIRSQERRIPTIYGNYDYAIGRDEEDCMCAYPNKHDRDLGQLSVYWTLEHTDRASKEGAYVSPFQ